MYEKSTILYIRGFEMLKPCLEERSKRLKGALFRSKAKHDHESAKHSTL